jgi:hypothetical protein
MDNSDALKPHRDRIATSICSASPLVRSKEFSPSFKHAAHPDSHRRPYLRRTRQRD